MGEWIPIVVPIYSPIILRTRQKTASMEKDVMLVRLISLTTPFSKNTLKMALPIVLSISRELQQTCCELCARAMAAGGVPVSQHSLCRSGHRWVRGAFVSVTEPLWMIGAMSRP